MKQTFAGKIDLLKLEGSVVMKGKEGQDLLIINIEKAGLFLGQKGCYLDCVCFYDSEVTDQFNQNGAIAKSKPKDSTDKTIYLGNLKNMAKSNQQAAPMQQQQNAPAPMDNDLPF